MAEVTRLHREAPLLDQPFAEQFALWAVRSWVAGLREGAAKSFSLQRGFEIAGIPDGLQALDMLLCTVATGAARPIDIRCVRCRWVSEDERAILAALAGCQTGATAAARGVFECLLLPTAARIAAEQASEVASELARGKLLLRHATSSARRDTHISVSRRCGDTVH